MTLEAYEHSRSSTEQIGYLYPLPHCYRLTINSRHSLAVIIYRTFDKSFVFLGHNLSAYI